ncbi:MAG: Chemotaxis protein methyltransferase CheR, partial [uncultured Acetobacteraceae bacterium]
ERVPGRCLPRGSRKAEAGGAEPLRRPGHAARARIRRGRGARGGPPPGAHGARLAGGPGPAMVQGARRPGRARRPAHLGVLRPRAQNRGRAPGGARRRRRPAFRRQPAGVRRPAHPLLRRRAAPHAGRASARHRLRHVAGAARGRLVERRGATVDLARRHRDAGPGDPPGSAAGRALRGRGRSPAGAGGAAAPRARRRRGLRLGTPPAHGPVHLGHGGAGPLRDARRRAPLRGRAAPIRAPGGRRRRAGRGFARLGPGRRRPLRGGAPRRPAGRRWPPALVPLRRPSPVPGRERAPGPGDAPGLHLHRDHRAALGGGASGAARGRAEPPREEHARRGAGPGRADPPRDLQRRPGEAALPRRLPVPPAGARARARPPDARGVAGDGLGRFGAGRPGAVRRPRRGRAAEDRGARPARDARAGARRGAGDGAARAGHQRLQARRPVLPDRPGLARLGTGAGARSGAGHRLDRERRAAARRPPGAPRLRPAPPGAGAGPTTRRRSDLGLPPRRLRLPAAAPLGRRARDPGL